MDSYRPQSPDLSYAPQSPDLSALPPPSPDPSGIHQSPPFDSFQHQGSRFQTAYGSQAFAGSIGYAPPLVAQPAGVGLAPNPFQLDAMPPASFKSEPDDLGDADFHPTASAPRGGRKVKQQPSHPAAGHAGLSSAAPAFDPTLGCQLRTSFPVARIKRIMQADEDIGKVAQVTPTVVSRALELFMIRLISAAAHHARGGAAGGEGAGGGKGGSRRVLAQHLKQAILADDTFDFLHEIVNKVPDAPAPSKGKKDAGSDSEDGGRVKKKGRKRKDSE